ncbi:unnamed protein product [Mesocestoides corti]|uniref:Uncharacterized protein n=2 Tax=Mesocestoides corti TaxID=53468 RepID=A0A0R3UGH2_MESCO|nr:unnamed protein product [Mesocestoides corti]
MNAEMMIITMHFLIYSIAVAALSVVGQLETKCFCGYRQSGAVITFRCASDKKNLPKSVFHPVLCVRLGDSVRIGDSSGLEAIRRETGLLGMVIEPYGLSQLQVGGQVVKLQLNLPLQTKLIDALALAGLPNLKTLHAWRAPLALEACSLLGLPMLENLVLSCASTFDHFLTFGPSFKSIRLIGCLGRPIQFICSQCTQRENMSVLRVLPGPPSQGGIVSYESFINPPQSNNSIIMGKCEPGVCSDDHICRYNYPLKLARKLQVSSSAGASEGGQSMVSVFVPILSIVLVLFIALCLFTSLRISRTKRMKTLAYSDPLKAQASLEANAFLPDQN